jgi:hypothetical protein
MNKNTAHTQHTHQKSQRDTHKSTKTGSVGQKEKAPTEKKIKKNSTGNRGKVKVAEEGEVVLNHANKWRLRCVRFRVYRI